MADSHICHPKSLTVIAKVPGNKASACLCYSGYRRRYNVALLQRDWILSPIDMGATVYLIFGEDEYLVSAKAKATVRDLVPPEDEALGLEVINGNVGSVDDAERALNTCFEAIQTVGFFGSQKLVWFQDVTFLYDNVVGKSESVKSRVTDLAAMIKDGLPAGQILVISSPKVDKRYALYKACKAAGDLSEFAVSDKAWQNEKQAKERLSEILGKVGLRMASSVMDVFLEKVGTETRQIVNEVEKLSVFIGDRQQIELSDIVAVTTSSGDALVWDLADAVGKRELSRALGILRQLMFQKESPIGLVMGLENRIRDLLVYREALDKGWLVQKSGQRGRSSFGWGNVPPEIDAAFDEGFQNDPRKTHPFRIGLLAEQAKRFSRRELRRCQQAVLSAHVKLVSSSAPKPLVLELLLIDMLS